LVQVCHASSTVKHCWFHRIYTGSVASAGTFFVVTIYALSGFANVLLVLLTRRKRLLFGTPSTSEMRGRPWNNSPFRIPALQQGALPRDSESPSPSVWHDREHTAVVNDGNMYYGAAMEPKAKLRAEDRVTPVDRRSSYSPDTQGSTFDPYELRHSESVERFPPATQTQQLRRPEFDRDLGQRQTERWGTGADDNRRMGREA
jgi:hypothetical protein